ncbi:hypothetical protein DAEQUDRAFT_140159 [Daedalea quercina L-15889]|uniref:Uncharacterized protein n=1 Tax=Daedalea quercina L-15889 TaxID=1314783 RepID=A0A165RTW0_9APHY|nr:hypothetical protein DAEQUDRAFT_140159 [Daedalea quercina L-15889]
MGMVQAQRSNAAPGPVALIDSFGPTRLGHGRYTCTIWLCAFAIIIIIIIIYGKEAIHGRTAEPGAISGRRGRMMLFAPHTAVNDPSTPKDAPFRESIELGTLVFY